MRINFIKRILNIFLCMSLVLSLNIRTYAEGSTFAGGFTIGGGGKGNPVWSFANIQTHMYKCILVNADGSVNSNFGVRVFYDLNDEPKLIGPNNIGRWPKEKYNSTYNYSARGGCLVCDEIRSFNFREAALSLPEVTAIKSINITETGSINFGAGIDFTRNKYQKIVQFGQFAVSDSKTTTNFQNLCKQLGVYDALGISPGPCMIELSVDPTTGNLVTTEVDSLDRWLRGYDTTGTLANKSTNKPYFAMCKLDWKVTSGVTTTKEKTPDGKTDFIIEKFAEPLQCKPEYSWGNIIPNTGNALLDALIPQAVSKLGTVNTNLGIVSGVMLEDGGSSSGGGGGEEHGGGGGITTDIILEGTHTQPILFEDELEYIYCLYDNNGEKTTIADSQTDAVNGNLYVRTTATVGTHVTAYCDCGAKSKHCDACVTNFTPTLTVNRTFTYPTTMQYCIGYWGSPFDPSAGVIKGTDLPAQIGSVNTTINKQILLNESPQGTVAAYLYSGSSNPYYSNGWLNQSFEGFRTTRQDLRSLWPDQVDSSSKLDMSKIGVLEGSPTYQATTPYHLNKYTAGFLTLTAEKDGELSNETWGMNYTASVSPTESNPCGKSVTAPGHSIPGDPPDHCDGNTETCEATITINNVEVSPKLNEPITFRQFYEVGYKNLGDSIAPQQDSYPGLGGKDGQFRKAIVHGETGGEAEHCGRPNILE